MPLPSQDKAKALCDLWKDRYAEWVDGGRTDKVLESWLECGSCEFCIEMRSANPPDDPYKNCKSECIFFSPCFMTYTAIARKVTGKITEREADTIAQSQLIEMDKVLKDNYP